VCSPRARLVGELPGFEAHVVSARAIAAAGVCDKEPEIWIGLKPSVELGHTGVPQNDVFIARAADGDTLHIGTVACSLLDGHCEVARVGQATTQLGGIDRLRLIRIAAACRFAVSIA
jgi:hypothetical protein